MSQRILLADDSMTAQNMGKKILSDAGYEVLAVSNGAAALKKATELKPDLVVLDIYMPGYTGLEVCERLKNAPDTSMIPVVLTVGKLEPYRAEEGARVRAEGVIIKPFEATDLLAAVQKILSKAAEVSVSAPAPAKEPEPVAPFAVMPPQPPVSQVAPAPILPDFGAQPFAAPASPEAAAMTASAFAMPAFDLGPLETAIPASLAAQPVDAPFASGPQASDPLPAISLDFLKSPVPSAAAAVQPLPETEPVLDQFEREQPVSPVIVKDPALATDPADMAEFLAKVEASRPTPEAALEDPLSDVELLAPIEETIPEIAPEQLGDTADQPGELDALAYSLADTQPIPHMPEQMPDGAGAAAIELFHEEYGPAPDGSIDLSVPSYQQAEPPKKPIFADHGLVDLAQTAAMDEYLLRQPAEVPLNPAPVESAPAEIPPVMPSPLEIAEPQQAAIAGEWASLLDELPTPQAEEPHQVAALSEANPLDLGAFELGVIDDTPAPEAPTESAVIQREPEPAPVCKENIEEPVVAAEVPSIPAPEPVAEVVAQEVAPEVAGPLTAASVPPDAVPVDAPAPSVVEPEPVHDFLADLVPAVAPAAVAAVATLQVAPMEAEPVLENAPSSAVPSSELTIAPAEPLPVDEAPIPHVPVVDAAPVQNLRDEITAEVGSEGLSAVDRARIAGAVQRVFDRYKPQIIAEITRELMEDE